MIRTLLCATLLSSLLISCSTEKPKGDTEEEKTSSDVKKFEYEIISENAPEGIKISDVNLDTASLHNDTKGILVTFRIEVSETSIKNLSSKGFDSYFIDLSAQPDKGTRYSHRDEIFKSSKRKNGYAQIKTGLYLINLTGRLKCLSPTA